MFLGEKSVYGCRQAKIRNFCLYFRWKIRFFLPKSQISDCQFVLLGTRNFGFRILSPPPLPLPEIRNFGFRIEKVASGGGPPEPPPHTWSLGLGWTDIACNKTMVGPRPKLLGPKLVPIDFAIFCPGGGGEPKMEPKLRFCLGQPKMEPKLRVGPIYGKNAVFRQIFDIFSVFTLFRT
jgi:hypothetical protein